MKPEIWRHSLGGLRGELQRRLEAAPQDEASSLEPLKSPGLGFRNGLWIGWKLHAHSKSDICRNKILDYKVVCTKVLPNGSKWVRIARYCKFGTTSLHWIRVWCCIISLPNRPIGFEVFWVDDDDDCKNTWDNEAREMCNKISLAGQFDDAV